MIQAMRSAALGAVRWLPPVAIVLSGWSLWANRTAPAIALSCALVLLALGLEATGWRRRARQRGLVLAVAAVTGAASCAAILAGIHGFDGLASAPGIARR